MIILIKQFLQEGYQEFSTAGSFTYNITSLYSVLNSSFRYNNRVTNIFKSTQFFYYFLELSPSHILSISGFLLLCMLHCKIIDEYSSRYMNILLLFISGIFLDILPFVYQSHFQKILRQKLIKREYQLVYQLPLYMYQKHSLL